MNSSSVPASATQPELGEPRRAGAAGSCAATGATGRLPSSHDRSHCTMRGARLPRGAPQRVEVEDEHHVAVAALPRGHRVAVDGVHVDVDGEQVVAALGAVRRAPSSRKNGACSRLPCSRPCMSVKATTTVSIAPASMSGDQPLDGQLPGGRGHRSSPCRSAPVVPSSLSPAGRAAARPCRRSAPPSPPGPAGRRPRGSPPRCARAGASEWAMLRAQHRDRGEQLVQRGLRPAVTASISSGDPDRRRDRQVQTGSRPAGGRPGRRRRGPRARGRELRPLVRGEGARGRQLRRSGLDDAPEVERVEQRSPHLARDRRRRRRCRAAPARRPRRCPRRGRAGS